MAKASAGSGFTTILNIVKPPPNHGW